MYVYIVMNESKDDQYTSVDRVFTSQDLANAYIAQERDDPKTADYKLYVIKERLWDNM